MSLIKFLKGRTFFIHLGLSVLVTMILIWIATVVLGFYTHHNQEIIVPDLKGLNIEELNNNLPKLHLKYEIIDSVYDSKREKGTVISQDPYANSKVKNGRVIYVTVIAKVPEQTAMPDLTDLTLRQAIAVLETYGLKVGKLEYVPDIAHNAVLKQKYKGKIIEQGIMIKKGSFIDLILGKGKDEEKTSVPFLLGKTHNEAIKLINEYSLNVGKEVFENGADTSNGRVYRQNPPYSKKTSVALGSIVNIWYKSEKKFNFKAFLEKYKNDTISDEK